MPNTSDDKETDAELQDIESLRISEHQRKQSSGRVQHGSTALIITAVLVLLALALGAFWILGGS